MELQAAFLRSDGQGDPRWNPHACFPAADAVAVCRIPEWIGRKP
jgi:hypothetical protein